MPYPKISAILNNCPLHAITPELKAEIKLLGMGKSSIFQAGYDDFKRCFTHYYGLDEALTWSTFAQILDRYNEFDVQILLGPVLRDFMESQSKLLSLDFPIDPQITQFDRANGRYVSLNPHELFKLVCEPLGFSLHYHQADSANDPLLVNNELARIHIHHSGDINGAENGGHWERVASGAMEGPQDYQSQDDTQLKPIIEVIKNPLSAEMGFRLMKRHVFSTCTALTNNNSLDLLNQELLVIDNSALAIATYFDRAPYLTKPSAIASLGTIDFFTSSYLNGLDEHEVFAAHDGSVQIPVDHRLGYKTPSRKPLAEKQSNAVTSPLKASEDVDNRFELDDSKGLLVYDADPSIGLIERKIETDSNSQDGKSDIEKRFEHQLFILKQKIYDFEVRRDASRGNSEKRYDKAIAAARTLHEQLTKEGTIYFSRPTEDSYITFKENCHKAIDIAHQELDHHREEWKHILSNIVAAIASAVVLYLIAATVHKAVTGRFLFFETDSSKKLRDISETVNKAAPSA